MNEQFKQSIRKDLQKEYARKEAEYTEQLEHLRTEVREQTQQESLLTIREKDTLINSLKEEITKIKNKLNNTSAQLKGEVQELELESFLKTNFKEDRISEIQKGVRGADCILEVCVSDVPIVKTKTLLIISCSLIVIACRKERTCQCIQDTTTYTYKVKSSKKDAQNWCEAIPKSTYVQTINGSTSTGQNNTNMNCTLK